jgi:hypothetical protein
VQRILLQERTRLFKKFFEDVLDVQGVRDLDKLREVHGKMGIDGDLSERMITATPRAIMVRTFKHLRFTPRNHTVGSRKQLTLIRDVHRKM